MAVPSSGALSMRGLAREKVYDNYSSASTPTAPYSMYDLVNGGNTNGSGVSFDATNTNSSSYPNTSTPHQMSEWYSYDHDAIATTSFIGTPGLSVSNEDNDIDDVCAPLRTNTYYHNGDTAIPQSGDTIYSDSNGSTIVSNVYIGVCGGPGGSAGTTPQAIQVNASGAVSFVGLCFPAPSPNPCEA